MLILERDRMLVRNGILRHSLLAKRLEQHANRNEYVHKLFGIDAHKSDGSCEKKHGGTGGLEYSPTYVEVILYMVDKLHLTPKDTFYDLGSGRGLVTNLVGLLTKAQVKGIEPVPEYVDNARRVSRDLGITNVRTIQLKADEADYTDGTVFYCYKPFTYNVIKKVAEKIRLETLGKNIRIVTFQNDFEWVQLGWLRRTNSAFFRPPGDPLDEMLSVFQPRTPSEHDLPNHRPQLKNKIIYPSKK